MPLPRRTATVLAAVTLVAAVATVALTRAPPEPWDVLSRAAPGRRPVEPRFQGLPGYAPVAASGTGVSDELLPELLAAAGRGEGEGRSALAAFYLLRAGAGDAERALAAAAALPQDPAGHNDRAAVLLALGRSEEALEELAAGAKVGGPELPAARFNRALALSQLELWITAGTAWEEVVAAEPEGSGFAIEAREQQKLAAAKADPVPTQPLDASKKQTLEALLAVITPAEALQHAAAAEELRVKGDDLLTHELAYLSTLPAAGWRERPSVVRRYLAAREDVFAGKNADSELRLLGGSEDPIVAVKALHVGAYAAIISGEPVAAERWLRALQERCMQLGCAEELAIVISDVGTLRHTAGDYQGAERSFAEAAAILPSGYEIRRSELLRKRADLAMDVGDLDGEERLAREAERIQRDAGRRAELSETFRVARADAAQKRGRHAVQLAVLEEAVALATRSADPFSEAEARASFAEALADSGELTRALELLRTVADRLSGTELRTTLAAACRLQAEVALRLGLLEEAERAAGTAVELRKDARGSQILSLALRVRARVARARAQPAEALGFVREAVAVDRERTSRAPGVLRARSVAADGAQTLMLLVELVAEQEGAGPALVALLGGTPALTAGECRLAYVAGEGELLTLALDPAGPHLSRRPLDREVLKAALDAVDRSDGHNPAPLDRLQALLGSPWDEGRCDPDAIRLAILELPATLPAPLALLARRQRPDALVATALHPLAPWPSARIPTHALAVIDPATAPGEPVLPFLPGAAREVEALRAAAPDTRVLRGAEATPEGVAKLAVGAELIHFAVHAEARRAQRAASFLRLAGAGGKLQVADILHLPLAASRPLVVLPACRSAGATGDLEHDGSGLPWAFLEAGASGVIASSQTLDDGAAEEFSRELYRALAAGVPPAEAVARGSAVVAVNHGPEVAASFVLAF